MKAVLKALLIIVAVGASFYVIALVAVPRIIHAERYKESLIDFIESSTGNDVQIGELSVSLWKGLRIHADDISLREGSGASANKIAQLQRITVGVRLIPLFRKKISVNFIKVHSPEIESERYLMGLLFIFMNGDELSKYRAAEPSSGTRPEINRIFPVSSLILDLSNIKDVIVEDGRITFSKKLPSGDSAPLILERISIRQENAENAPATSMFLKAVFSRDARILKIRGTLNAVLHSGNLDIQKMKIDFGMSQIFCTGNVDLKEKNPFLKFSVTGENLVWNDIRNIFSVFGKVLPADLKNSKLDCSATGDLLLSDLSLRSAAFSLGLYDGTIRGTLKSQTRDGKSSILDADISDINANSLITALSPSNKDVIVGRIQGQAHLNAEKTSITSVANRISGILDLKIRKGTIATIDSLKQVASVLKTVNGRGIGERETEFDLLEGSFAISVGEARTDNLAFRSRDIDLDGSGVIRFDSTIDFDLTAKFSPGASKDMVSSMKLLEIRMGSDGRLSFPLKITGSLSKPEALLDINTILRDKKTESLLETIKNFIK